MVFININQRSRQAGPTRHRDRFAGIQLARSAANEKRGILVVYYVAPQFWAWRQGRVRLLRD